MSKTITIHATNGKYFTKEVLHEDKYFVLHHNLRLDETGKLGTVNKDCSQEERVYKYVVVQNSANCLCDFGHYSVIARFTNKSEALRFIKYLHKMPNALRMHEALERIRVRDKQFLKTTAKEYCCNYIPQNKTCSITVSNFKVQ